MEGQLWQRYARKAPTRATSCRICEAMANLTELTSRIHSDRDIRNIALLEDFVNAATNFWVLTTSILEASAPHQASP